MKSFLRPSTGFKLAALLVAWFFGGCSRSNSGGPGATGQGGSNSATGGDGVTAGQTGTGGVLQGSGAPGAGGAVDARQGLGGITGSGGAVDARQGLGGMTGTGGAIDVGQGFQATLAAAVADWKGTKASCPVYRYQVRYASVFGSCSITTIEIANDQPVRRSFVRNGRGCIFDGGVGDQWEEVGTAQIGSHSGGESARTVEQLLTECATLLTADPSKYRLYLTVGPQGVPTACGKTRMNCFDDCSLGIEIPRFTCEPQPVVDAGASYDLGME